MRGLILLLTSLLVLGVANEATAQRKYLDIADEYYSKRKYREAIDYYKLALEEKVVVNKYYMLQQVAKTYNHLFDYENAATYYQELTTYKGENKTDNLYDYGRVLCNLGEYDKALEVFSDYASREDAAAELAYFEEYVSYAQDHKDDPEVAKTSVTNIETGSRSLGVSFSEDGLIIATPQTDKYDKKTAYYDLASVSNSSPNEFGEPVLLSKELNGPYYEGTPYLYKGGTKLLFSSNSADIKKYKQKKLDELPISEDGRNILKICSAELIDGEWTNIKELAFNGNNYSCVFPNLSPDGETLFFASDMPGGYGGYDIWYVTKENDTTWSTPQNLGEQINTFEDETYPFATENKLFFSSKGHPGFGGTDIFVASLNETLAGAAKNVGRPLNSTKDDFSFILSDEGTNGYLSSNREGTHGYDKVYYFYDYNPSEIISGVVREGTFGEPLADVKVELYKKNENDDWELVEDRITGDDGYWEFEIDPNETYKVEFIHPDMAPENKVIPSLSEDDGDHRDQVIEDLKDIELKPVSRVISGVVEDAQTGEPLADVKVILNEILPDGSRKQVETQITIEDGKWQFEVDPDKNYDVQFIHPELGSKNFPVDAYDGTNYDEREGQIDKLKKVTLNDDKDNILAGIVLDQITEKPVEGVTVTLLEDRDGEWIEVNSMVTGDDGKWSFEIDPTKEYKVKFDKDGFEAQEFVVPSIDDGGRDEIIAKMNPLEFRSKGEKDAVIRVDNIYFDFARSHPQEESYPILDNIVDFMNNNPTIRIELSAHTDAVGKDDFNMKLSQARAERCKDYLVNHGIKASRIEAKGYGETKILNGCVKWNQCSEEENQVNRRVEIKVL
ncbi:carboxypeptidase regulatory-like domain-containing protein [Parvicella tangerina]|uniref:Peptidoglycan-associated lipoprotein n=1 Tax=Parvicella tangerina TaxID=2829795 RepID=A0A916NDV0_9FLAO|nr:carboxypeptidase regulatory-like domain-containing protein [Parvicella tangerina]CAG5085782.1 Peptidoglycan-associated lipoprotein [Parvicella tangerina]